MQLISTNSNEGDQQPPAQPLPEQQPEEQPKDHKVSNGQVAGKGKQPQPQQQVNAQQLAQKNREANGTAPPTKLKPTGKASKRRFTMHRALAKLNKKQCCLRSKLNESLKSWDDMVYAERQNSVGTLDLFKYASIREQVIVIIGIVFMWYAASWQPISVFILAIMASLMGQYSKQISWLEQLNNSTETGGGGSSRSPLSATAASTTLTEAAAAAAAAAATTTTSITISTTTEPAYLALSSRFSPANIIVGTSTMPLHQSSSSLPAPANYESFPLLSPLYSFVSPIFDFGIASQEDNRENIKAAIHDILQHESNQFLRKSFEINGSAFLLALTQLIAFFIGMTMITWVAKKQASRVKILYFRSCLHQEVTWFEAIDSASGSGSSLNGLVEKYEDGIGMKLALLCYFLGHVALFAITAFYQMFKLAAFCMPFVLLVGLVIAYLSEWQAVAIGQQALFAKRSLQLAEEIIAAIRTVFAFNGQQKEITRYSISLQPVYRKSLIKHLYTALNTSLSKFSIFACFACYCFYAMRLFPPYDQVGPVNKATVLAVMRGAEVSIVNILISIPFMEALQQSKGSIARIYAAIERRSKINPSSDEGAKPKKWSPSITFRMVQFGYADRSGPTRPRRSTLPFLNLAGSPGSGNQQVVSLHAEPNVARRRRSLIEGLDDELAGGAAVLVKQRNNSPGADSGGTARRVSLCGTNSVGATTNGSGATADRSSGRRQSAAIKRMIGGEINSNYSNRRILNYFNLNIKAGQSVALVGPSGSGKSTVLSLIQRLYDITGGQILIGQNNIKDLSVSWLRNQIGVVTQEPRLFDMSIADNIRLGLSEAEERSLSSSKLMMAAADKEVQIMRQVVEAAIAASAHQFIIRLPEGYNTRVGSGGVQLSGGQKQRIAIARALIRKPKILLLDESTSALDTESEAQVQKALQAASVGRTTLTVAHRLATIRHVDLIVVMYQGQVVESGSHEELIKREATPESGPPIYRQMYEDQLRALESESSLNPDPPPQVALDEGREKQVATAMATTTTMDKNGNDLGGKKNPLGRFEFGPSEKEGNTDFMDELEFDEDDNEDEDDDEYDDDEDDESSGGSSDYRERVSAWQLWQFIEMPKWSSLAAAIVCLLAGLVLPMNLIAHSYLFTAFAYNDLDQLGNSLHVFGLVILSFSTFVFIVSFLQVILPGYVGEKLSTRLRVRTIDALLSKPMFYFDMDSNSAGALCDRFNSYISSIQSIAGTRVATMLEAISTLAAGAFFGFGQSLPLSLFCLSFALLVLFTTIIESRILQRESSLQQKFDAQLAHLMADALSNIKTIASLNKERFFIDKFSDIIRQREVGTGKFVTYFRTFLTSLKFIMPAMSWSASMYYGCHLLVEGRIDLQTIFIALVFLPELLKARKSIERLHKMNHEFSPQVLQMLTLAQQFEQQNQLHLAQVAAASHTTPGNSFSGTSGRLGSITEAAAAAAAAEVAVAPSSTTVTRPEGADLQVSAGGISPATAATTTTLRKQSDAAGQRPKKSISFSLEPEQRLISLNLDGKPEGGQVGDIEEDQAAAASKQLVNRRLSNIGNLPTYMRRKSSRLNSLIPRAQARGRIEFRDVDFAYPNRPSALVLDGFSLSVAPGESVALVGSSGSGKSTCVSILEKFYDFHAGKVSLDGRDLRLMDNNWTRSQIGLVSQEPTLLSYTIGDNIRYGDNSRFVSMEEVVEAARTANIHDFIMSLPDQYDTELSTSTYSSSQLSGGQRQRIAIARALIRNAPILIFDEATSALDSRNETVVQDALNKARKGRTNLTIAHRLATVRDADKIAVLRDGKVVEVGRHEELLRNETGHYRMLWERQEGALSGENDDINAADDDDVDYVDVDGDGDRDRDGDRDGDDNDDDDDDAIKRGPTMELRRTMNDERSR